MLHTEKVIPSKWNFICYVDHLLEGAIERGPLWKIVC